VLAFAAPALGQQETPPRLPPPRASADDAPVGSAPDSPPEKKDSAPADIKAATEEQPEIKPTIKLRGRINTDALFVNQSQRNEEIFGDLQNAVGFRRARLGAEGTVGEQVYWVAEFDFAGGDISFKDVLIGLDKLPVIRRIQVGHMLEPFSLEANTSANDITFMERSPIMFLDPVRNWGAAILSYTENERATFQAGVFRNGTSNNSGNDIGDQNDLAYTFRATALPWYKDDGRYLMHIGGAFSQRFAHDGVVTINQGPQSNLLQFNDTPPSPFVSTIKIPADDYQLYNVQWAAVFGPLSFQAEWSAMDVNQIGGGPVFLHGAYAYASLFLTGEHRQYETKDGVFGRTRVLHPFVCMDGKHPVACGPGAWELTARFAYADFANANIPPASNGLRVGDREAVTVLGVNWYLNDYTRLMFNFTHVVPVDPNFGPSRADEFGLRFAIFW
jgi:phosphate-selective porin OprO/OprP